jgi:SAM-dependent methyltransferase
LNLGCGTKVSSSPDVINIDWSIYLRLNTNRVMRAIAPLVIRGQRLSHLHALPTNIMVHDLAKGLPFRSDSVDVVYHSHLFEHLDREQASAFLLEAKRVLKPGGVQRIVVPDLERACRAYLSHISESERDETEADDHDLYVAAILEQCVRKEAYGTSTQRPLRRLVENALLGDARRRGETHQWMYDRINLTRLLCRLGFQAPQIQCFDRSWIRGWQTYGLDVDDRGNEYKPGSLYVEARKRAAMESEGH